MTTMTTMRSWSWAVVVAVIVVVINGALNVSLGNRVFVCVSLRCVIPAANHKHDAKMIVMSVARKIGGVRCLIEVYYFGMSCVRFMVRQHHTAASKHPLSYSNTDEAVSRRWSPLPANPRPCHSFLPLPLWSSPVSTCSWSRLDERS